MVIPGPVVEVVGNPSSRGPGAQPPDAEKVLILHACSENGLKLQHLKKRIDE